MIPARKDIKRELVRLLTESVSKNPAEVYKYLADHFSLTPDDLSKTTDDKESYFEKEVRWAKKDLVDSGLVKRPSHSGRGVWTISESQVEEDLSPVLCESPEEIEEALSKLTPAKSEPKGQRKPKRTFRSNGGFERDARVIKYVLDQAAGICEICDHASPFKKDNGEPFLEVHHVKRLADSGPDFVTNAVAACPNCHRELHYGVNREALIKLLYSKIRRLVEA